MTAFRPTPQSEDDADYGAPLLRSSETITKQTNQEPVLGCVTVIEVGRRNPLDKFRHAGDDDGLEENMSQTTVAILRTPNIYRNTPVETPDMHPQKVGTTRTSIPIATKSKNKNVIQKPVTLPKQSKVPMGSSSAQT